MKRREFIKVMGGSVAASSVSWQLDARAQAIKPVIGFVNGTSSERYVPYLAAFLRGLKAEGFVEGGNLVIEYRWAHGQYDRLPALVADLVSRKVAVIAATSTPASLVAKAATTTIPIVFTTANDPVQLGLVTSLSRPGGNITGATQLIVEVGVKRLELARELAPTVNVVTLLVNPDNPSAATIEKEMMAAATTLGLRVDVLRARSEAEIDAAFAAFDPQRGGVLVIGSDPFFNGQSQQLGALSIRYAVPAIYQYGEFTAAGGGLASYGGSITDAYHQAGAYTGRILKGEKPSDLPVLRSTKVEPIINLKTAKALGLTIPLTLLGRADAVVE